MEYKKQCPRCARNGRDKNNDNLHVYGEGKGAYCWACGYTELSDDEKEKRGIDGWQYTDEMEEEVSSKERLTQEEIEQIKGYTGERGNNLRGITDETYKHYLVRHKYDEQTGQPIEQFYPITEGYKASGFKIRVLPKEFKSVGRTGRDCDLFGQWRWKNASGKYVVITAGEVDCLSAFQMLEDYRKSKGSDFDAIPVVSSVIGETGSDKQIAKHYEWLNRFEKIIVCYDQDEAGKEAVSKLVKVLPKGKMYVMELPLKDSNLMLTEGRSKQWINAFFKARPYTPEGIVSSVGMLDSVLTHASIDKIPLPPFMHRMQKMFAGGIPLGVIINLGGASGQGKSTLADEILYYWIFNSPYKVGILSLESDVGAYGTKLLSRHLERKIELIEDKQEKLDYLNSEEVKIKSEELLKDEIGNARFFLIDERDGGIESVKNQIMKLIIECECKVIVIDPTTDLIDSLTNEDQAAFMSWQKGLVKSHKVTLLNILHTRKTSQGQKAGSAGADLHEEDFHGNSSLYKSAAANILFSRNKEAEDEVERNTMVLKLSKCRWTGNTSPFAGKYYYDNNSHRLYDFDDWMGKQNTEF